MKFLDCDYDEETKCSTTLVQHLGCVFYGDAIAAPDEVNLSQLFGGRLSEARAILHALQYERSVRENEYRTISNMVKACCNTKRFDKESPSAKTIFHQLNISKKRYKDSKEKVKAVKKAIKEMMDDRDRFFEKRAKKDKDKE